jgi:hypothetical protein
VNPEDLISTYKILYRSIGSIPCSYFDGERIFFNKAGFNHLIRKGKIIRAAADQNRRLALLKYCKEILGGSYISVESRIVEGKFRIIKFWAFRARINGLSMKLIVRQFEGGAKQFLGIFPIKH